MVAVLVTKDIEAGLALDSGLKQAALTIALPLPLSPGARWQVWDGRDQSQRKCYLPGSFPISDDARLSLTVTVTVTLTLTLTLILTRIASFPNE